jgi:hypothetical protein
MVEEMNKAEKAEKERHRQDDANRPWVYVPEYERAPEPKKEEPRGVYHVTFWKENYVLNASYKNGVLLFEENCPPTSPGYVGCGDLVTIRRPGHVGHTYATFEVVRVEGEARVALEVGSKAHTAWLGGKFF